MSKLKLFVLLAALCALCGAQTVTDGPGVTVDLGGASVLHRTAVRYPMGARTSHTEGTVVLELQLDANGTVADARVLSGPLELRASSILSVLQWHFTKDLASTTRQVRIAYQAPSEAESAALARTPVNSSLEGKKIGRISVFGLPNEARNDLLARLPVHEGDAYSADLVGKTGAAAKQFDEHIGVVFRPDPTDGVVLQLTVPGAYIPPPGDNKRITIGGNVQQAKLVSQARPVYPPEAKQARVQGVVQLQAIIGTDGHVASLSVIGGHPLLVPAAVEAVSQWVYQQTLLNGVPVEVITQIDVNFTLSQ